jgi:quinol monooxygenase YgiN
MLAFGGWLGRRHRGRIIRNVAVTAAQGGRNGSRGIDMWAQLVKMRVQPGKDTVGLNEQLQAVEQPDSGLVRTILMRDQEDSDQLYTLIVFESEEKARAREQDPRRQEGLRAMRAMMGDILAGPPEFTDLTVIQEWTQ